MTSFLMASGLLPVLPFIFLQENSRDALTLWETDEEAEKHIAEWKMFGSWTMHNRNLYSTIILVKNLYKIIKIMVPKSQSWCDALSANPDYLQERIM